MRGKRIVSKRVARIAYSSRAPDDSARALRFLAGHDHDSTVASASVIRRGVEMLAQHPYVGRRVERDVRELVRSFGRNSIQS